MPVISTLWFILLYSIHSLQGRSLPDKAFLLSQFDANRLDSIDCDLCNDGLNTNAIEDGLRFKSDIQERSEGFDCSRCPSKRTVPQQIKIQAECRQCRVVVAQTKRLLSPCVSPKEVEMVILRMCIIVSTTRPIEMCTNGVLHGYKQMEFWKWKISIVPYYVCQVYGSCGLLYKPFSPVVRRHETREPCVKKWEKREPCMKRREWPRPPSLSPQYPLPLPTMSPSIKEWPLPKLSEIPSKPCRPRRPVESPQMTKTPVKSVPFGLPKISEIPHQIRVSPIPTSSPPSSPCTEQDFIISKDEKTSEFELDNDEDHLQEMLDTSAEIKSVIF